MNTDRDPAFSWMRIQCVSRSATLLPTLRFLSDLLSSFGYPASNARSVGSTLYKFGRGSCLNFLLWSLLPVDLYKLYISKVCTCFFKEVKEVCEQTFIILNFCCWFNNWRIRIPRIRLQGGYFDMNPSGSVTLKYSFLWLTGSYLVYFRQFWTNYYHL